MLRNCSKMEFEEYVDFAYDLAMDLTKSGYPTYCDGIKTKDFFIERSLKAFERENEEMLIFEQESRVQGFIHIYWLPEDRYLSICSFNICNDIEQALAEFMEYVSTRFIEYDLYLEFPVENSIAINYLKNHGFACISDCYNNTGFLEKLNTFPKACNMLTITEKNFEVFRCLHDQDTEDNYWNSERMFMELDRWTIFVLEKSGNTLGAIYYKNIQYRWYEIFGIDLADDIVDQDIICEMLLTVLSDAKAKGGRFMTFVTDDEMELIALECGFECVGRYVCYMMHLE